MAIQLPPNSTGTVLDTVTVAAKDRQLLAVADPAAAAAIAAVTAKGAQGAYALAVQQLSEAGRAFVSYYMAAALALTATDTLQSLTGTKAGATVTATTTPAVVTAGTMFRIQRMWATFISTTIAGYAVVSLRYQPGGLATVSSPVLQRLAIGSPVAATQVANQAGTEDADFGQGIDVAAGAGIGISAQGFAGTVATAQGLILVGCSGFEW